MATSVAAHYARAGGLLERIVAALPSIGKTAETVSAADLSPCDEFHLGGTKTAVRLMDRLDIHAGHAVLDVGSGIGGPARLCASTYGCTVTGLDVTPEFVDTANALSGYCGMADSVACIVADATDMASIPAASIDRAYMLHVGMNIADKAALARELYRVLKPGSRFGLFDMVTGPAEDAPMRFPLPFASAPEHSQLGSPQQYREAFESAGFSLREEVDQLETVRALFAPPPPGGKPPAPAPPLGMQLLMGDEIKAKMLNAKGLFESGAMGAREMVFDKH